MRPYEVKLTTDDGTATINALEVSAPGQGYFIVNADLPSTVTSTEPFVFNISHGTHEPGNINAELVAITANRKAHLFPITAVSYEPISADVTEKAPLITVPFVSTVGQDLYDNYLLPGSTSDGKDVVYKMNVENDVLLNASVEGENGKIAVYTENFSGEPGPGPENNYTGPSLSSSTSGLYEAQVGNTTTTYFYFPCYYSYNYSMSQQLYLASELTAAGASAGSITSIAFSTQATGDYDLRNVSIWLGNTTEPEVLSISPEVDQMTKVYDGNHTKVTGWNEFVFDTPFQWDGSSNILVLFVMNNGAWKPGLMWDVHNPGFKSSAYIFNDADGAYNPANNIYPMHTTSTYRATTIFKGLTIGGRPTDNLISDMTLTPGVYYLAASATSEEFTVSINSNTIPVPEMPTSPYPSDGEAGISAPVALTWNFGNYTTSYRVLFGTTYPPTNVLVDWTDNLSNNVIVSNLINNKNYFWRVEERNSSGTTVGPVWGFTTTLNIPQNLSALQEKIYEGDALHLTWTAVNDRSNRGYNIYQDGEKINTVTVTANEFDVNNLSYNMEGYTFNVTAVYDEGESSFSNDLLAYVSGYGTISGQVNELDGTTGINEVMVTLEGTDEFDRPASLTLTTGADGTYTGNILAGNYTATAIKEGYQAKEYETDILINYNQTTPNINFVLQENLIPVNKVIAEELEDNMVKIYWSQGAMNGSIEDFESGDLLAFEWNNDATYPWSISTNNPYEGSYCIKSGNEGVASSTSSIEITMEIPYNGMMSFYSRISSEANYDKGHFFIDNVEKYNVSGEGEWKKKEFAISEGVHTFKWTYTKDNVVNGNDDCFYVDFISFIHEPEPFQPGSVFNFDDGTFQGWTTIDADGDGYSWEQGSEVMGSGNGHDGSSDLVLSRSYINNVGALFPDNYLVSPQVPLGGSITFYACAQDAAYAAEHFGVAVSTTGNVNASDFNTIQEWTMTAKSHGAPTNVTRDGSRVQGNWYQYTVDLSAYSGNGYVAIRHFNCTDNFYLDVDDITINTPGKTRSLHHFNVYRSLANDTNIENATLLASVNDTNYIDHSWAALTAGVYHWGVSSVYEGNRSNESEIVWSNTIDKDMTTTVTVQVNSNSNDPVAGASVTLTNTSEPTLNLVYQATLEEGNTCSWDAFRKGSYEVSVELSGFNAVTAVADIWESTTLTYTLSEIIEDIEDLYVSTTGWAMFGEMSTPIIPGTGFTYGFEEELNDEWNIVQLNPTTWERTNVIMFADGASVTPPEGEWQMYLQWNFGDQDEWLITPEFSVPSNAKLKFWTYVHTGSTHDDHYYTKITTDGGTTWTELWDATTLPADDNHYNTPIEIDLSAYAGQSVKLAWQGWALDGLWYTWFIDDITVASPQGIVSFDGREWKRKPAVETIVSTEQRLSRAGDQKPNQRHVEYYKVRLNGALQGTTTLPFFQHNVENLVEGETYTTSVQKVYSTGESEWKNFDWIYKPCDNFAGLKEHPSAHWEGSDVIINWVLPTSNDTITPPDPTPGVVFSFDNDLEGWTLIDADGDGHNWYHSSDAMNHATMPINSHSGNGHLMGESYCNSTYQVLNPDDYLVSPQKYLMSANTTVSFWACAQDQNYPAEHFGVAVSTTGNTNASDFTTVQEWTLTAKNAGNSNPAATRDGKGDREGTWHQYTCDMSSYAGQEVWIAIRHFACSDQFIICLDDLSIGTSNQLPRETFSFSFDNDLEGWTSLDADGDGHGWLHSSTPETPGYDYSGLGHNGTSGYATSASYIDFDPANIYVYSPNNFLISPQKYNIANGSTISFWADYGNDMYPDHFAVVVATANNPTADDFTIVWEGVAKNSNNKANVRRNPERYNNWREHTVDLSEYAGQEVWIAFRHFDTDQYELWIDDITITASGGSTPPDDPTIGSDIIGVEIFRNGEWIAEVLSPNQSYTDMAPNDVDYYEIRVVYDGSKEDYSYYAMSCPEIFEPLEPSCNAPDNLGAEYYWNESGFGANIHWTYGETNGSTNLNVDFDDGLPSNWTMIDADGDGNCWVDKRFDGYNSTYCVSSASYINFVGALNPDNYLVTPQVELGGTFSFWACAQDVLYPAEHFGVAISTGSQTNPADFNTIKEWTMTAKGTRTTTQNGTVRGTNEVGTWYQYTVDLSDYAGQTGYIAIRHFNCTDNFWLNVDEVELTTTRNENTPQGFHVYRDEEIIATVPYAGYAYTYQDEVSMGSYKYQVTAIYDDCESDFALTNDMSADYVEITVTNLNEETDRTRIYPNPTSGIIMVEARDIRKITVMNVLGQTVYETNARGDQQTINLGKCQAGVYLIRIESEDQTYLRKVTLAK